MDDAGTERARRAVAVVFAANGLTFASWASRTPAIRDELGLSPGGLGALIVSVSVGALLALPLSGSVVGRIGPGRAVRGAGLLTALGMTLAALGLAAGSVVLAVPGFALLGLGSGTWDVAMNVEGAAVERRLGRVLMPRFHAAFSSGTVLGAALGASCAALGVGVAAQLLGTALVAATTVSVATRGFLRVAAPDADAPLGSLARGWRERRTLLLGLMVLAFALGEGIANDWLAVAQVDGHGASDAAGALTFGAFVAAMTLARLLGGGPLERFGRARVLRGLALVVATGSLVVALGPAAPWAAAGAVVWGVGASLGFPVGMSAAADEPEMAAVRVSVVSSIGYTAFLGGPALVGALADALGILDALLVVPLAMGVAIATAGAARPPGH